MSSVRLKARCPRCAAAITAVLGQGEPPSCQNCGHRLAAPDPALALGGSVQMCCVCGGGRFYRRRDLPRGVGLAIVASSALVFLILLGVGVPFGLALLILLGTAALDAWLYRLLKEVTVCYRCAAEYRGNQLDPSHQAFDIHMAEEYR